VSVQMPTQDSRSEMILRRGGGELMLLDNERWASPLSDQIRDAVRTELQREISEFSAVGSRQDPIRIQINVQRMDAAFERYTVLEATWTEESTNSNPDRRDAQTCSFRSYDPIGSGYSGVVQGYQREVQALAEAIGADISSLRTDKPGCGANTFAPR
jgi:uncharacterized protein